MSQSYSVYRSRFNNFIQYYPFLVFPLNTHFFVALLLKSTETKAPAECMVWQLLVYDRYDRYDRVDNENLYLPCIMSSFSGWRSDKEHTLETFNMSCIVIGECQRINKITLGPAIWWCQHILLMEGGGRGWSFCSARRCSSKI